MKSDPTIDVLFESLRHIALRYDRKVDRDSLLATLPVDQKDGVTPALFPRIAARAGFKTSLGKTELQQLASHIGPSIVLLQGNQVGVLYSTAGDAPDEIYLLDANSELRPVDYEVIKRQYSGYAFTLTHVNTDCLLYTSPSPRDRTRSRMPSSA